MRYTSKYSSTYEGRGVRLRVARDQYGGIICAHVTVQGKTLSLTENQIEELTRMIQVERIDNDNLLNEVI